MENVGANRVAVRSSAWLDLFRFQLLFGIILEHASRATQQKGDNHDAHEYASWRMRDKPGEELEYDDNNEHGDYCEAAAAKNEKCKHTRNGSDDNAKDNGDCSHERRVLEVLL